MVLRLLDNNGNLIQTKTYYVKKGAMPNILVTKGNKNDSTVSYLIQWEGGRYSRSGSKNPDSNNKQNYNITSVGIHAETLITVQAKSSTNDLKTISMTTSYMAENPKDYLDKLDPAKFNFAEQANAEIELSAEEKNVTFTLNDITYSASNKDWRSVLANLPFYERKDGKFYVYKYDVTEIEVDGETVTLNQDGTAGESKSYTVAFDRSTGTIVMHNTLKPIDISILKVDADKKDKPLGNAVFKIRKLDENAQGVQYAEEESKTKTSDPTDKNGKTGFTGLQLGFYEVYESAMPAGYIHAGEGKFYIQVTASGVKLLEKDNAKKPSEWKEVETDDMVCGVSQATDEAPAAITVQNTPGAALPNTGGRGTTLFAGFGAALTLGAVLLFLQKRRVF